MTQLVHHDANGCLVIQVNFTKLGVPSVVPGIAQHLAVQRGRGDTIQAPAMPPHAGGGVAIGPLVPGNNHNQVQFINGNIAVPVGIVGSIVYVWICSDQGVFHN